MSGAEENLKGKVAAIQVADLYPGSSAYEYLDMVENARLAQFGQPTSYKDAVKAASKQFKLFRDSTADHYDRGSSSSLGHRDEFGGSRSGKGGKGTKGGSGKAN